MKKIAVFLVLALFSSFASRSIFARGESMIENDSLPSSSSVPSSKSTDNSVPESIETVLQSILTDQQIDTVKNLDCQKVSDNNLEKLGEAVMENHHPGAAHKSMDRMMGGEGSGSLRSLHINMGEAYLGCGEDESFGMMGGGMMGLFGKRNSSDENVFIKNLSSILGSGYSDGTIAVLGSLTWLAGIGFLLSGIYYFLKNSGKK